MIAQLVGAMVNAPAFWAQKTEDKWAKVDPGSEVQALASQKIGRIPSPADIDIGGSREIPPS